MSDTISNHAPPPLPRQTGWLALCVRILGCLMLLAGFASLLVVNLMERKHVGRVKMVVHQNPASRESRTAIFAEITSPALLGQVIQAQSLQKKWNLSESMTMARLRDMIEFSEERGTDILNLAVYSPDMNEAAELANHLAEAWRKQRQQAEMETASKGISQLELSMDKMDAQVAEKKAALLKIIGEQGVAEGAVDQTTNPLVKAAKAAYEEQLKAANAHKELTMKAKVDLLMPLAPVQLLDMAYPEPAVVRPNITLILSLGAVTALLGLVLLGLSFLRSSRV